VLSRFLTDTREAADGEKFSRNFPLPVVIPVSSKILRVYRNFLHFPIGGNRNGWNALNKRARVRLAFS